MSKFSAEKYKEQLKTAKSIDECEKVPVRRFKKDDSYIFISYSHKDYKKVYADLADLHEKGIPFWYDKGLIAGKNWDDVVREKMTDPRCSGVIFYLSESLFLSQSIQTEIRIATGEDGDPDMPRRPLTYFSVNLTAMQPSELLDKIYGDKKFDDAEDRMAAKRAWVDTLAEAFDDKKTYLPFAEKNHISNLVEQIGICFGIAPNENPYVFGSANFVSGSGTIEFENGSRYTGLYRDNLFDGQGELRFHSGAVYTGAWAKGKRLGHGTMTWPEGTVYEGQWEDGKRDGQGKMTWPDGMVFEGQWKDDKRNGQGRMTWRDGTVYEGQWKDGKQDGYGRRTWSEGTVYEGQWENGKRDGQGRMTRPEGTVSEGMFQEDKFLG